MGRARSGDRVSFAGSSYQRRASGASGPGGPPNVLTFQPNGVASPPNQFTSWAALYAEFLLTFGPVIVAIDTTFVPASIATIDPGTWDFQGRVGIVSSARGAMTGGAQLAIPDGSVLQGLSSLGGAEGDIQINVASTVVPPLQWIGAFAQFTLLNDASILQRGAAPVIRVPDGQSFTLLLRDQINFNASGSFGAFVDLAGSGSVLGLESTGGLSLFLGATGNLISGVAGSQVQYGYDAGWPGNPLNSLFLGAYLPASIIDKNTVVPNAAWSVPNWYVDPINGNDSNAGTAPTAPVKTIMGGIVSQWDTISPVLKQPTSIHVVNPETLGQEDIVLAPVLSGGVNLQILCTTANVGAPFPAGSVTPKVQSAAGNDLTIAGFPIGAIAGQIVFNVTKNSYALIDSITAGVAVLTQPLAAAGLTTISVNPALVQDNTWAPGDSLQLRQPALLNLKLLSPQGGDANLAGTAPCVFLYGAHIPDVSGTPGTSSFIPALEGCTVIFSTCTIDPYFIAGSADSAESVILACSWLNGGGNLGSFTNLLGGALNSAENNSSAFSGGLADFSAILHAPTEVGRGGYFAQVHATGLVNVDEGSLLKLEPYRAGGSQLWGSGTLNLLGVNSAVENATGGAWATVLTMGALQINGSATGTRYAVGVFTDGIAVTSANLDATGGLQNPRTGARFAPNF